MNRDVVIADYNGERIVKRLFRNYYKNPRLLSASALRRIYIESLRSRNDEVFLSALNLCGCDSKIASEEIKEWTEK